jgi:hypothetical protein
MRNYTKISKCPDSAKEILDLANSLPNGYQFNFGDYPDFDADKHKKWFFELVATLPKDFFEDKELLKMVLNGETISPDEVIKQKKFPFFEEVSKQPPHILKKAWREYFIKDGKIQFFYPLDDLTKGYIQPAINCRHTLTMFCLSMSGLLAKHTYGGKPVLPGAAISNCRFTMDDKTGVIELAAHYPLSVIISERLDARRFRLCPNCDTFFWAKRLDAKTCGKKACVEALSVKKYQTENKDELNRKKRKKYYEDNGIEFCPTCIYKAGEWCECNTPAKQRSKNNGTV